MNNMERLARFDIAARWPGRIPKTCAQIAYGVLCFGGIIVARLTVDLVAPTAGPFALIYPFTLIATLFGSWRAGLVTFALAYQWAWYVIRPHTIFLHLGPPADLRRTLVNALSTCVILLLADAFRNAVHIAVGERDAAIRALEARETALRDLNDTLERQVAERTREITSTWRVSPDLLGVLTTAGYFESSNPAWQETLGWREEEVRSTRFVDLVHSEDLQSTNHAWSQASEGKAILHLENRCRRKDGTWRWLSWVLVPEGDKFFSSARDITGEKDRQHSLAATEEALRQSQKLEAVGQLTGGVAHDFNNLLTVILGSVDMLRRESLTESRRNQYIEAISGTASRAAKLTGQLLAFSRRQPLDPVLFSVGDSLHEVLDIVRTLIGSSIELEILLPEIAYFIFADRSQFDTAIVNIAINARDAMPIGGRLTIAAEAASCIPGLRSHPAVAGDFIAVSISDTGRGIAAELADRIFEPFFTTKPAGQGTGLGLSQVFGFAKQSGGDVALASIEGHGATFTLYLPRAYQTLAPVPQPQTQERSGRGEGICVLVVEDNCQVGSFATQALQELGYDSVLALDAKAALAELEQDSGRFHIVFSDVVMPGMNGFELGGEIKRRYPDVPVVLTSGYSHVLTDGGKQGFALLHKPYSLKQLSCALREALVRHPEQKVISRADA